MTRVRVQPPQPVAAPGLHLGRLGPALRWLAAAQGSWPPRAPSVARRVVVGSPGREGATRDDGEREADDLVDSGCDLVLAGAAGDQVAGLVVLSALLDLEPVQAVGTAAGPQWAELTTGVRDGLRGARMHVGNPDALLRAVDSSGLAHLTGLLAQCAVRQTPVLLDGAPVTAAAAVLADRIAPGATAWWFAGQVPPAPAARLGLEDIGMTGLLDLQLALPEGADVAYAVLQQALALLD